MTHHCDLILVVLVMLDLYILSTSRLGAAIRATAFQGLMLALLPLALFATGSGTEIAHSVALALGMLLLKAIVIPALLLRALYKTKIRREVEPFVSLHLSLLLGAAMICLAFWASAQLPLPRSELPALLVPIALATVLIGFLLIVSRKKAITQVVGYLVMENGIFVMGMTLSRKLPFAVELGILLDLLVGVFVFGIVIHHISAEFDHMDTDLLSELKD